MGLQSTAGTSHSQNPQAWTSTTPSSLLLLLRVLVRGPHILLPTNDGSDPVGPLLLGICTHELGPVVKVIVHLSTQQRKERWFGVRKEGMGRNAMDNLFVLGEGWWRRRETDQCLFSLSCSRQEKLHPPPNDHFSLRPHPASDLQRNNCMCSAACSTNIPRRAPSRALTSFASPLAHMGSSSLMGRRQKQRCGRGAFL